MSEVSLRIRDIERKDLEVLYAIDHLCFPVDVVFTRRDLLYYLRQTGSIARIAEVSGRIEGFILGHMQHNRWGRVITLDVVPGARRRGIGSALMDDFHRILKENDIHAVFLEVGTGNIGAQLLYERMQYRRIEALSGYYNGKEDAYRMLRSI